MTTTTKVKVRVPTPLSSATGGERQIEVTGSTVREVLQAVGEIHPEFLDRILVDGGELREFLNIFVNGSDVRFEEKLDTRVQDGDEISIVPSIAGGAIP